MIEPRLFLCNGVKLPDDASLREDRRVVELSTQSPIANVHIRLEDVARVFMKDLLPRFEDLLEIAAYVYTADCATRRGEEWSDDYTTEPWDRDLKFIIPVRDLVFWTREDVQNLLIEILDFLSNDKYAFEFCKLRQSQPKQCYLEFGDHEDWPFNSVERVLMFSGGLDSLAGAVETAAQGGKLVLVSHRPVATLSSRQRHLFNELRKEYPVQMIHIPVWVNKDKDLGREHTQRTRSFLYSALGMVVAESVKAAGIRFFENGIVSLNLPVADEVLRARASRTTHPKTLHLLSKLLSLVAERGFVVDNPYLFKTKADVISTIAERGAGRLIKFTCSCAHTGFFKSKNQWHCGTCSQCIDRRIAILAAGQESNDPDFDYVSDVFIGHRKDGYEQNMAVDFARHAIELHRMSDVEISTKFNREFTRAVRFQPNQREAAQRLVEMHKKHGGIVNSILQQQVQQHADKLVESGLDESSMLALVVGQQHMKPLWNRYSDRIIEILAKGLPIACKTHKPKDEPHLQEVCDGILRAYDTDLVREFPFMRWSSSLTKPDWSAEPLRLWVELKYVRKKADIRPITEAIAADITKYGDNQRHVLFVIYDPSHIVTDEQSFSEPILRRQDMLVNFIR